MRVCGCARVLGRCPGGVRVAGSRFRVPFAGVSRGAGAEGRVLGSLAACVRSMAVWIECSLLARPQFQAQHGRRGRARVSNRIFAGAGDEQHSAGQKLSGCLGIGAILSRRHFRTRTRKAPASDDATASLPLAIPCFPPSTSTVLGASDALLPVCSCLSSRCVARVSSPSRLFLAPRPRSSSLTRNAQSLAPHSHAQANGWIHPVVHVQPSVLSTTRHPGH